MNSRDFFETEGHEWKGKSGVYCIEQPALSQYRGKRLFKIGYARNSIYTRMSDFRSAYGIIPFTIHSLIEIPAGVHFRVRAAIFDHTVRGALSPSHTSRRWDVSTIPLEPFGIVF